MTTETPRAFALPFDSITMTERRMMASKFGVNWDAVEVELADMPRPVDPDEPTQEEKMAIARVITRAVGPNERFALMWCAVKRQEPTATEAQILANMDTGEWVLSTSDETAEQEVAAHADPLPAPTPSVTSL